MNLVKFFFLFLVILFFIIEVINNLYLTAITQLIISLILLYYAIKLHRGSFSRLLLFLLFFISYPTQVIILTLGYSTLPIWQWNYSYFVFDDYQNTFILLVSGTLYFALIIIHNMICLKFYRITATDLNNNLKNIFLLKKNTNSSSTRVFLWILFLVLLLVIIIQNKYGWGIHGMPHYRENFFKLAGLSIYLRDYILPALIAYTLFYLSKVNFSEKIVLLLFSITVAAVSWSKVSLFVYFFLFFFACLKHEKFELNNIKFLFQKNKLLILGLFFWIIFLYAFIMVSKDKLITFGNPVNNQLFLIINIENIVNFEKILNYLQFKHLVSLLERFLGFKELASVIYYTGYIFFEGNFLESMDIGNIANLKTNSAREFTSNLSKGGVGVDWISKLVMSGYFMIFKVFLISFIFLIQILIINFFSKQIQIFLEFIFMLFFIRYALDGNFFILKWYFLILIFALFALSYLKKISINRF